MKKIPLKQVKIDLLTQYGLDPADCTALYYDSGEVVFRHGQTVEFVYFVVSGSARVEVSSGNGLMLTLTHCREGGLIGDIELMLHSQTATVTIRTETPLVCLALRYQKAQSEVRTNIRFSNLIGQELASKLDFRTNAHLQSVALSAMERLSHYLLAEANQNIYRGTLTDVASSIGVSYRHLLRMIHALCEEKILLKTVSGYQILDENALLHKR